MNTEQQYTEQISHRPMSGLDPLVAPVMPGPEIATAVSEKGESSVPDISSDTTPKPHVELGSAADLARLLREAGLSRAAAKAVTAGGWKALKALSPGQPEPADDEITALVDAMKALHAKLEER